MTSWFLSDIHLKDINERSGNILLRFLFELKKDPTAHQVFLLGDIFDAWVSDGTAFTKHYRVLIECLRDLKKSGTQIHYFEGNHDVHIDIFWTKKLNIPVYTQAKDFEIDGLKFRLEHGDYINPDDLAYINYRESLNREWVKFAAHTLPGFFWKTLGEYHSLKSRKKTSAYANQNKDKIRYLIRTHALRSFEQAPFDYIINGHMHVFDDYTFEVQGKSVRSVNLGTWLDVPRIAKFESKKLEIINVG